MAVVYSFKEDTVMNDVQILDLGDAVEETKQPPEGPIRDNAQLPAEVPLDL